MTAVGNMGCGFRSPLEAAYKALHDPIPENANFLRGDADLIVLFVSDKDDCSAPAGSTLFDPQSSTYGALTTFRCAMAGITCGASTPLTQMASSAPLTGCQAAAQGAGGPLYDVQRYIDFFTKPMAEGGIRVDPAQVILAAIGGATTPLQVVYRTSDGQPCDTPDGKACIVTLAPACGSGVATAEPAVRLFDVVQAAQWHAVGSECATDYTSTLQSAPNQIQAASMGCLPQPVADAANPACTVAAMTAEPGAAQGTNPLPRCDGQTKPCWNVGPSSVCAGVAQGLQITIEGEVTSTIVPPNSLLVATCQGAGG
jgi:hypothetical protein